jgi:prevent-host-death family protein
MKTIGAFEAKTHFSELLVKVSKGESIIITKHNQRVAMLIPLESAEAAQSPTEKSIETIRSLRKGVTLGKNLSIKALKEMGRK